jgi:hypothetical protein
MTCDTGHPRDKGPDHISLLATTKYTDFQYMLRDPVGRSVELTPPETGLIPLTRYQKLVQFTRYSVTKLQRWRMYLQQFTYEIRHVDGNQNATADGMSQIFEDLSSLHIANLMATAPTNEQARKERQLGIVAPSTRVLGGGAFRQLDEVTQCGEDEMPDGPEGGSDEALFAGIVGGMGVAAPHWGILCSHVAEGNWPEVELAGAEDATFEDFEFVEGEGRDVAVCCEVEAAADEESEAAARYGKGWKLLEQMGWSWGAAVGRCCRGFRGVSRQRTCRRALANGAEIVCFATKCGVCAEIRSGHKEP